ncbi:DUF4304 domain-containing protein [Shewanella sp. AS16]|uniref:DUF4304 domain-containing protein n=1 Tax=Shewanella sp. AS16 TaxID=2907625 RepID=UPI001F38B3FD|nr:DUF4304 domain-containing protein [Shewanella sp. AS16]MCE9686258.1 DUF4304 domain-containing protein [Shewanella sp. AS16]
MLSLLIKKYINPVLKLSGFKKKGMTWNRELFGAVQVIDIQFSSYVKNRTSFTINIGILNLDVFPIFFDGKKNGFVGEVECFPRFRLKRLLAGFDIKKVDEWWNLSSEDDVDIVGAEVEAALKNKCLPMLDSLFTLQDILTLANEVMPRMPAEKISYATLLLFNGEIERAKGILAEFRHSEVWGARVEKIYKRFSIVE